MDIKVKEYDTAALIGRFQCHEPHEAHCELIQSVLDKHNRVIVFIGLAPTRATKKNPLTFQDRKTALLEKFPELDIYYIEDNESDYVWSKNLDNQINKWTKPGESVVLYGSRDSFLPHYHGKYDVLELQSTKIISASTIRKRISVKYQSSVDYRAGIIAATADRYDICYPTVDIVVHDKTRNLFLVGQKPGETKYRFVGGFAEPKSQCFEDDAIRELHEEVGMIEVTPPIYLGSSFIDDWRYRGESDKIKTLFFLSDYVFGHVEAGDDLEKAMWVSYEDLYDNINPIHLPLLRLLEKHFKLGIYSDKKESND